MIPLIQVKTILNLMTFLVTIKSNFLLDFKFYFLNYQYFLSNSNSITLIIDFHFIFYYFLKF